MPAYRKVITARLLFLGAAIELLTALPLSAVSLTVSGPPGASQPVGTVVQWTAMNAGGGGTTLQFRWLICAGTSPCNPTGSNLVFRDFNTTATITYAPMQEGFYTVTVTARDAAHVTDTDTVSVRYGASSLLTGTAPKVTGTHNPLVAIYSATCPSGSKVRVFFAPRGTSVTSGFATPPQACTTGKSVNFIIAGMRASTTYNLQHQVQSGFSFSFPNPPVPFTTGSIPTDVSGHLQQLKVRGTPTTQQPVVLESTTPVAFDTSGNVIWYNYPPAPGELNGIVRPISGGTMYATGGDLIQEIDLLGNVVRETNRTRMQEQLSGPPFNIINGKTNRVADFNHDAIRLPNGDTATISLMEQIANQGLGPNPKDVLGDLVLVLDKNYQLKWAWNTFGRVKLPITRLATLNDTCASGQLGCPLLELIPPGQTLANDWMHANSLTYTGDGDLLLSLRSQDWVLKIDYANGTGTGKIIWRLGGNDGDFKLEGGGQWFSHQHDATLRGTTLTLFDNANGTHNMFGDSSRGLALKIDEQAKTVDITDEGLMGSYSFALGTAQILLNGNLWFLSGVPNGFSNPASHAIEFTPGPMARPIAHFDTNSVNYRSFRMKDLYTP